MLEIIIKRIKCEINRRLPSASSSRKAGLGSSLHFVSLRMTDICALEEEVIGGSAANHLLLP